MWASRPRIVANAIEWGGKLDPNQKVRIACLKTPHMLLYRIEDPGTGFRFEDLSHAAIGNPEDDPFRHGEIRQEKGMRPGGFGIVMVRDLVDELLYNEVHNEVVLIKYLNPPAEKKSCGVWTSSRRITAIGFWSPNSLTTLATRSGGTWWCSTSRATPKMNYIKRMIGLPHETVLIYHGDILTKPDPDPAQGGQHDRPSKSGDAANLPEGFKDRTNRRTRFGRWLKPFTTTTMLVDPMTAAGWPLRWQPAEGESARADTRSGTPPMAAAPTRSPLADPKPGFGTSTSLPWGRIGSN